MEDNDELIMFLNARILDDGVYGRGPMHMQSSRAIITLAGEANDLEIAVNSDRGVGPRDWPYVGDQILRWLAWPHSRHPDWRPEWAPILPDSVDV